MTKQNRKEPLAWGIILIAIGLIFLLANINVDIWDFIARLWPLVLIIWGAWKLYFGLKEKREESEAIEEEK